MINRLHLLSNRAYFKKSFQSNITMHIMHSWNTVILGGCLDTLGMLMEERKIAL